MGLQTIGTIEIFFIKSWILDICFIHLCLSRFLIYLSAGHMIMHFMLDEGIFYIFSVPSELENLLSY